MLQSIFSAIVVYISTSVDYLVILVIIFSRSQTKKDLRHIYLGQYLGTGILVAVSLFAAYVLNFIPKEWIIGLLGLIPIYLGIRAAVVGEEEEVVERVESVGTNPLFWTVALTTIALGGDNLGIYIPYFVSLSASQIIITLVIFAIFIAVLCYTGYKVQKIPLVSETIERYKRIIVPFVFIGLGIYIMVENKTIQVFFSLFN